MGSTLFVGIISTMLFESEGGKKKHFAELFHEFQDIFAKHSEEIAKCEHVKHRINTEDNSPIKQAPRKLPLHRRKEIENLLMKMEAQEVIETS
ncbi:hypothetical protein ANTQUA_LOCUS2945 [Anthophora quadrimaculata]